MPAALCSFVVLQSVVMADTRYGPVRAGETLSSIVNENYMASPFPDQTIMREIFRRNPQAFIYHDMGLLKQNVMLTLPSNETIARSVTPTVSGRGHVNRRQATVLSRQSDAKVESLEKKLASVRAERDRANEKLRSLDAETARQNEKISELRASNVRLNAEIKSANVALKAVRTELSEARAKAASSLAQAKLDNRDNSASLTSEQAAIIAERDRQIESLEASIATLQSSKDEAVSALENSLEAKKTEYLALEKKVKALTEKVDRYESQIAKLKEENEALALELSASKRIDDRPVVNSENEVATGSAVDATPSHAVGDQSSNIKSKDTVARLSRPVTFPLWGLLLGGLALTALMVLLARRRSKVIPDGLVPAEQDSLIKPSVEDTLVFRAVDPNKIEPDVDALRVPPRRDPSRVAILDPTMEQPLHAEGNTTEASESDVSEYQQTEAELKLAMAEAYDELGDLQAARELLAEVQIEGSRQQSASAQLMLKRLAD
ncbi:MAG: hypothetical protein CSB47_05325 [Proteobacteria bacterium]|nr:MAG: hypothetical protein CSB47_05325 [Pseudomonadota bacterium]